MLCNTIVPRRCTVTCRIRVTNHATSVLSLRSPPAGKLLKVLVLHYKEKANVGMVVGRADVSGALKLIPIHHLFTYGPNSYRTIRCFVRSNSTPSQYLWPVEALSSSSYTYCCIDQMAIDYGVHHNKKTRIGFVVAHSLNSTHPRWDVTTIDEVMEWLNHHESEQATVNGCNKTPTIVNMSTRR